MQCSSTDLIDIVIYIIGIGFISARLLYVVFHYHEFSNYYEMINIYSGGLWLIGGILGNLCFMPLYLYYKQIPIRASFDLLCLHIPLVQSISRLGCFFGGCCYGASSTLPWAYQPIWLNYTVHPTQLYSSLLLLLIFFYIYFYVYPRVIVPGQITLVYLLLVSGERFFIDFFRDERKFLLGSLSFFSINQWLCVVISISSLVGLYILWYYHSKRLYT